MAINVSPSYPVNTPPIKVDAEIGSLWSISHRQFRYCALECMNDAVLQAGIFVTVTTNALGNNIAKGLTSATDIIFGVSYLNTLTIANYNTTTGTFEFPIGSPISIITEGDIMMWSEAGVTVGADVYTRHTADVGLTRLGAVAGAAGNGLVKVPGAKFLKTTTAAGKVPVSLQNII